MKTSFSKKACFSILISILLLLQTNHAYPLKPFTVMLDWQLNPDHASLWVAKHYGFFAQQGLDVTWMPPSDPSDPARFAAVGKVDVALTYEPQWILQTAKGLPVTWVATLVGQPLEALITSSDITSIQQLRGKTVAYSSSATGNVFLDTLLKHAGVPLTSVKCINVHYAGNQALIAKRVAATSDNMRNVEPIELREKGFAFHEFYPENNGIPSYAELIFVSQTERQHKPEMHAFATALKQAAHYLKQHPETTWEAFAKENPALADTTNHAIWLATIGYFSDTPEIFNQAQYDRFKSFLRTQGFG